MNRASAAIVKGLMNFGPSILPFADAATAELPMSRLLRLSLFQVTVGMAAVLLIGTLNRVMIVELAVPSWIVASDARAAAAVRALPRVGRLPFRQPSLGARLEARSLHLARHDAAIRRPRDHAVRAADPFGRHDGPALDRPGRRGARVPAGRRGAAYGADRWPRARDGSGARARASARRRAALRDAAGRHGGERARLRPAARAISAKCASYRSSRARRSCTMVTQQLRALEAGAARLLAEAASAPRAEFSRRLDRFRHGGPHAPAPDRDRARHRRLQHAGHPARALWRQDPASAGRRHHGA